MLFIWGMRVRRKTLSDGTFYCLQEGGDRAYVLQQMRRWFTVFFIPLIPLKVLGEVVECRSCGSAWDPRVIATPTNASVQGDLMTAVRHAVVALIRADGRIDDGQVQAGLATVRRYGDPAYAAEHLRHDVESMPSGGLSDVLVHVGGNLAEHGKENLLQALYDVASADGAVVEAEVEVLREAGSALGMSRAHVSGVLEEADAHSGDAPPPSAP